MKKIYAGYIVKIQAATMRLFDALDDDYPNTPQRKRRQ